MPRTIIQTIAPIIKDPQLGDADWVRHIKVHANRCAGNTAQLGKLRAAHKPLERNRGARWRVARALQAIPSRCDNARLL